MKGARIALCAALSILASPVQGQEPTGWQFAEKRASDWSTTGSVEPAAPFDRPFYLILNLAVGGRLPEDRARGGVSHKDFPKSLEIEWVCVWQCAPPRDIDGSCLTGGDE